MAAVRCSCQYFTASVVAGAVFLLLLGNIAGIVSIISIFEDTKTANFTDYGIVIDAGSSHSVLWIFSWNGLKERNTGEITKYAKIKGDSVGIDQFAGNASAAAESITTLVTRADSVVGAVKNRTWLYLGATAGMRLLRERNKTAADDIMQAVQGALSNTKFFAPNATIITGLDEAKSSWTSVNYLKQKLLEPSQTVGSIDFGGASLELAFQYDNSTVTVNLYGQSHSLYAHSYLCYGRDQMEFRLLANLAQGVQENNLTADNPCLPLGFQMSRTVADIWSRPCATMQRPKNLNDSDLVTFNGTSDSAQCTKEVESLFPNVSCSHETCGINGTFQPLVNRTYYALGLFKVLHSKLPQLRSSSDSDWDHFKQTVETWCQATLTELRARYPGEQDNHTAELCFDGHLMWTTLIGGLKFSRDSTPSWTVMFASDINGVPLGWPMGYMTLKTNSIFTNNTPYGYDRIFSYLDLILSIILLSLVAVILALLFIATVRVCLLMRPQTSHHLGYTPLGD